MTIVDASVAVKWFLPEATSDQALALVQGKEILVAPDLIRVEVANAITRRLRRKEIELTDAKDALNMWFEALKDGVVQIQTSLEDVRNAANYAIQLNHSIYDCVYLALAHRTSSRIVTADAAFANKAKSVYPKIEVL